MSIGAARDGDGLRLHRVRSDHEAEPESDLEALRHGYVSVTEAHGGERDLAQTFRLAQSLEALL